jgi:myo-inositol catabolism protein IolS
MGCWGFGGGEYWGPDNQSDTNAVVAAAVGAGINFFDTAEAYNEGRSETALGQAIRDIPRDRLIVASKISPAHCYPEQVEHYCDASLKRLGTDYLDIYMIHWPIHPHSIRHFTKEESVINHPPLLQDTLGSLEELKRKGRIREIGISNFSRARMLDIPGTTTIAANELPYNLLCRAVEFDALPACVEKGVGVIGYMTLLQGILAGVYPSQDDIPLWQRRTRHFSAARSPLSRHGEEGFEREMDQALADIGLIARDAGLSMATVATRWALAQPGLSSALVGARNIKKLEENIQAARGVLEPEILERLNRATEDLKEKMGPHFDYYESKERDRTV